MIYMLASIGRDMHDAKVEMRHVYLDPDTIWVSRIDLSRGRYGASLASYRG